MATSDVKPASDKKMKKAWKDLERMKSAGVDCRPAEAILARLEGAEAILRRLAEAKNDCQAFYLTDDARRWFEERRKP